MPRSIYLFFSFSKQSPESGLSNSNSRRLDGLWRKFVNHKIGYVLDKTSKEPLMKALFITYYFLSKMQYTLSLLHIEVRESPSHYPE